jgi:predicted metal-dependent peptidase
MDLKSMYKWKKGHDMPRMRTRSGGTDFDCVQRYCNLPENKGKWQGVIILTDGYAPTMGQVVGSKVMWVITPQGTMEAVRSGDYAIQMRKEKTFKKV